MATYNGIIKGFTAVINKLDKLAETNAKKEDDKTRKIKVLKEECQALEEEGKLAISTATKLRDLLG